tara:strand:- start:1209 stop:2567 length:1359 start_codon:yes stop_codon:yes gene_type:complete
MNILAIHTSHDGSITIVKNNSFFAHAQIDRFNNVLANTVPPIKLLKRLKGLNIQFDAVIFSFLQLSHSYHGYWEEQLIKFNLLKPNCLLKATNNDHHYYHTCCAKATVGNNKNIVVIDGHGSVLNKDDICEQESIFQKDKKIYESNQNIGYNYELRTAKEFNLTYGAFRSCGKLMALAAHKKDVGLFQKETELKIKNIMPKEDVTYTGGVAQNVLANSQFLDYKNFKIDPLCTDQGISLGVMYDYMKGDLTLPNSVYLGLPPSYEFLHYPTFKDYDIVDTTPEDICEILKKNPVALFQGRSEQGQRGLGNRSLLMDGTHPHAVALVNKIKRREWFRPFSPAIMEEYAEEYFDIKNPSPYMLYVFKTKKDLPNVSAIDKTARIQTVNKKNNFHFYNLLSAFNKKYKIPFLLNTSLNLAGHTLVEDLDDLKYMLDYSDLKYAYLPEVGKLIISQ